MPHDPHPPEATAPIALVWFRDDLRLDDQPALRAAIDGGYVPLPVYVHAPDEEGSWAPGAASNAWRHRSLAALDRQLRERGSRLRVFAGPSLSILQALVAFSGAQAVFWTRRYAPAIEQRDTMIKRTLRRQGLRAESFNGALLFEPWDLATQQGDPYRVFTPFWKAAVQAWRTPRPWDAPVRIAAPDDGHAIPDGLPLEALRLAPARPWDAGFWQRFTPGGQGARAALDAFLDEAIEGYATARDVPARRATSRLSPHLHFGEISVQRVVDRLRARSDAPPGDVAHYLRELGWREFAHHLLHHFPHTPDSNLNPRFQDFDWAPADEARLDAWRHGRTGVPIVDAGMRELYATGWMHNRVRMIVASYLCKHLRMHWRHGARWFWDTLVDADLANNTQGWQWTAGTGADAAPYFRMFNPVTQARSFDPDGRYIARWLPELAGIPLPLRFAPWTDPRTLAALAPDYPRQPLVDLAAGREAALAAYRACASS
ncbi:cryptochrome/photolyase family protein [Montanilutibacter psychrotolerans]|uniref:Deoxyribodipyrimidine photo-lyase n=1 Tax=Montanilutibacter psychrotolerans TaxID=1327343 RepID=A0A3M8SUW4_9GAMM|nr:deoxyribodipyrimidine photo-lyase [Lysobacter psychrotolerans]RNF83266.1 deoxyribodipyrimidine photo-lyase [Lysobacter psychrotolerans]